MEDEKNKKLSFAQFLGVLRWLIAYNIKLAPVLAITGAVVTIVTMLSPLVNGFIVGRLLDTVIAAVAAGADPSEAVPMLAILLGYNLFNAALNSLNSYVGSVMSEIVVYKSLQLLYRHINALGIQTIENPDVVNKLQRSREVMGALYTDFDRTILFVAQVVTLIVAVAIVVKTIPIVVAVIAVAMLPGLISNRYHARKSWKIWRDMTEERRRAFDTVGSLTSPANLQEVTITSSFNYLSGVYDRFAGPYMGAIRANMKSWQSFRFAFDSVTTVASIFGYFTVLKNLFKGAITVGDVTFQMRSLDIFINQLSSVGNGYVQLYERCIRVSEIKAVFDMEPMVADGKVVLAAAGIAPLIELKNISFKYPNSNRYVINDLNLIIKPGDKIAIVGENGAGKTTLVKLLSRFYKVNKGSVSLNGTNINDIKIDSWYKNLGVLFQDYNTYGALTLKENILMGDSEERFDQKKMELAANKANIGSFLSNFKKGYNQVLSERYKGGTRPSTGQWQKIAIARFFYRNSPVVIFDEPTASIDAVAEAEIFGQIYEFFKDKTVIIISHRFSTVRNADRIYVVDGGSIVESGNHDELMQKKGKYHRAFTIQAEGYK